MQYAVGVGGFRARVARRSLPTACCLRPTPHRRGFSLIELLIVVGIIILVIAMSIPAFNLISGARSVDAAENQVGVLLGRARAEAIGVQGIGGIMFYRDGAGLINMALVRQADPPAYGVPFDVDIYLDLDPSGDTLTLPKGVGAQVVDDVVISGGATPARQDDGFIGYNTKHNISITPPPTKIPYGGVILFDGHGQLVSKSYALKCKTGPSLATATFTRMGTLLYQPDSSATASTYFDVVPALYMRSAIGLVLFDQEMFSGNDAHTLTDPQIEGTSYTPDELNEERWLDQNSLPLLVNRYNGTLVRGE